MKKTRTSLVLASVLALGTLFPSVSGAASPSTKELQKQITVLKAQVAAKDKEIKALKEQTKPLTTSLSYQGTVKSGNVKIGSTSVPTMLSYKGIQYTAIPVFSSLLNLSTLYDSKLNTTYIGEGSLGFDMSKILKPYYIPYSYSIDNNIQTGGISYSKGYNFSFSQNNDSYPFNLSGKYTSFSATIGLIDGRYRNDGGTFSFYGDGKLLKTLTLVKGVLPERIEIPVKGVRKFELKADDLDLDLSSFTTEVILANPKIK